MKVVPQVRAGQKAPAPMRTDTVFMGRDDFFSTVIRLIGVELYKLRRRAMSIVLLVIALVVTLLVFGIISAGTIYIANTSIKSYLPPPCSQVRDPQTQPCDNGNPSSFELARAAQDRQGSLNLISAPLRLPTALFITTEITQFLGIVLLIILAGVIIGGEFGGGTVRLLFTRGPTRTQFFLAKIGAILICTVIGYLAITLIGVIIGALLNLVSGVGADLTLFSLPMLGHTLLYILIAMFNMFMCAMIAFFLGILGRSTVAGVAGALGWLVIEFVLSYTLGLANFFVQGPVGDFLKAIPDYFISNNANALLQNQGHIVFNSPATQLSDIHAWIVLLVYLILFISIAWWFNKQRDITN